MEEAIVKAPHEHLFEFVVHKHKGQVRKYTGEPYFNHVKAVAEMADGIVPFGYEIGLCHDLLEDTDCERNELNEALKRFGYSKPDAWYITIGVDDLTDVFTSKDYQQYPKPPKR